MRISLLLAPAVLLAATVRGETAERAMPDLAQLQAMTARFAPVDIKVDLTALPANEQVALGKMVDAAKILDAIFRRQSAAIVETVQTALVRDTSPLGRARLHYFDINAGPWSRLDEDVPFIPGVGPKPKEANFYPSDATRADIEKWMRRLNPQDRASAAGFFTTIRRKTNGEFVAVPYSIEYQGELVQAARLLSEAAEATRQATLKTFLEKRARAFLTNDYLDSDMAWMDLNATIEPTIGPYEVYEDDWFGYKAAFEAFIATVDAAETTKLVGFSSKLQELEDHLPIDPGYRRKLGALSPIRVVDLVYCSGDARRGVQTAAFNLPNDERVVAAKGSKRVMLKNVQEAKFEHVLVPIAQVALAKSDQADVAFDPFFSHILLHELMHGLGPQTIRVNGRETTVRAELKELNGTLEEAKADISSLWALQYLMDHGGFDKAMERPIYTTYLASSFRTLRFGLTEAHAKGMALQVNWILDHGGFAVAPDGTFSVKFDKVKEAVESLTHEIMTIQAHGDYAAAKAMIDRLMVVRPEVRHVLDALKNVPVDIEPHFVGFE